MIKDFQGNDLENMSKLIFDISSAVIPYSKMLSNHNTSDIYSGKEKIPFNERILEYKRILQQEFAIVS
ncbi:MAG: hypothetical protein ACXABO_04020 [Promethearchaeota archaeon]|jgi:hypothetical protein